MKTFMELLFWYCLSLTLAVVVICITRIALGKMVEVEILMAGCSMVVAAGISRGLFKFLSAKE